MSMNNPTNGHFTPTEQRIMEVLYGGFPHTREELEACLNDEMATRYTIGQHLFNIRKKIRPRGLDIVYRDGKYRYVRLLAAE